jgi:hypothetical protein
MKGLITNFVLYFYVTGYACRQLIVQKNTGAMRGIR